MNRLAVAATIAVLGIQPVKATITVVASPVPSSDLSIFDGLAANTMVSPGNLTLRGLNFNGTGLIFNGSFDGIAAQPAFTTDNYMAVLAGHSESITLENPASTFRMVLGSVDLYNTITVDGSAFTGSDLQTLTGVVPDGNQASPLSNVELSFTGSGGKIDQILVTSSGNSAEFIPTGVPEPSTWAMLILGFASLAWVGARKARTARHAI